MRYSYGCSYEEIAAAEGISRVAVWKHLSRVLNSIKKHLKS
jgi:DNA-directed RNA polymerase specialized sigma24 family protein